MKEVSSEFLFHFTNSWSNLSNIMNNYFMPFYCLEKLTYLNMNDIDTNDFFEMAFPLVCFCDIPVDLQTKHREIFGSYGIALNKSWGIQQYLTPVLYTHKYAIPSGNLRFFINFFIEYEKKVDKNDAQPFNNNLSYLLMHYKSYSGYNYLKEERKYSDKPTKFYDEREWRFIPRNCENLNLSLNRNEFEDKETLERENKKVQACNKLKFKIEDIKYIYLVSQSEVKPFLNSIQDKYESSELSRIEELIVV